MEGTTQHFERPGIRRRERRRSAVPPDENEIRFGEVRRQRGRQGGVLVEYWSGREQGVGLDLLQKFLEWRLAGVEEFAG
jgi:hypothetical protein